MKSSKFSREIVRSCQLFREVKRNMKIDFTNYYRKTRMFYKVWKNEKFTLTEKIMSSNQLSSNFFSNTVTFTKFLPKKSESKFETSTLCCSYCCTIQSVEKLEILFSLILQKCRETIHGKATRTWKGKSFIPPP